MKNDFHGAWCVLCVLVSINMKNKTYSININRYVLFLSCDRLTQRGSLNHLIGLRFHFFFNFLWGHVFPNITAWFWLVIRSFFHEAFQIAWN
jgi:hypothetical protein